MDDEQMRDLREKARETIEAVRPPTLDEIEAMVRAVVREVVREELDARGLGAGGMGTDRADS